MDTKLKLKPIEVLDIGIDKLTKIPVPILNVNMVSTYDMDGGVPSDSFLLYYNAGYGYTFYVTLVSSDSFNLYIDYGDGTNETNMILTGGTIVSHTYTSATTYTITMSGWLDKITSLTVLNGLSSVSINYLKKLSTLNLSGNILTNINIENMIYLKNINLSNNYFLNDEIDDIYNTADTFLIFGGSIDTTGANNGTPSVYSTNAINSLINKFWTLNFNT
jgi:hypothetical protein